jgi:16S rRNA processing protein RimM
MTDYFSLGAISSVHGLKGEMKLFPFSSEVKTFSLVKSCLLGRTDEAGRPAFDDDIPIRIVSLRPAGRFYLLRLEGINVREQAEALKGKIVFVPRGQVAPLEEGTWFISDLIGLSVITGAGELLGTVSDVLNNVAQDLFLVDKEGEERCYLPIVAEFLKHVDLSKRTILYDPPAGLIELYRKR